MLIESLRVAGTQATCPNEPSRPSDEVSDGLCHSPSVDLSNIMGAQRELINKQPRNACASHGTKATTEYHDKHSITFGAVIRYSITPTKIIIPIYWKVVNFPIYHGTFLFYKFDIIYPTPPHEQDATQGQF